MWTRETPRRLDVARIAHLVDAATLGVAPGQPLPDRGPLGEAGQVNRSDFDYLLHQTFRHLSDLTESKGREYAGSADQLANFKRLADRLCLEPEQVLLVYLAKHLDAIDTYVRDYSAHTEPVLSEPIEGRIDDAILYLCLLKALIRDQ
jgi:hypothetical protein